MDRGGAAMRVLRTEKYFNGSYIRRSDDKWLKTSNICVAWIESGENSQLYSAELPDFAQARHITPDEAPLVLDYIVRRERMQPFADRTEALLCSTQALSSKFWRCPLSLSSLRLN